MKVFTLENKLNWCGACGTGFRRKCGEEQPGIHQLVHLLGLTLYEVIQNVDYLHTCDTCGKGFTQKGTLNNINVFILVRNL